MSEVGWDVDPAVAGWTGLLPLSQSVTADACVVGLGASGLAAVEALADRGLSVVGVDAGRVATAAAGRNGGFLIAGPALFLHDALAQWGPPALDLYRDTLAEIARLAEVLPPGVLRRVGSIRLAGLPGSPAADELEDCGSHAAALREHGITVEDYDGPLGRGLYLPDDAAVNPAVRALALARMLEHRAALHEHTPVLRVRPGVVETAAGRVSAPVIIVAVDGRLGQVLRSVDDRVRTARLQMLATAPIAPRLPCPVYGRWGYDYAQQTPDGRLFVGGGRDRFEAAEWTDDAAQSPDVQAYVGTVAAAMAGGAVEVTQRWAASVGFTSDARPLCVQVAPGVVGVGGYSGTGNLVGPVAARAAVALAVDGTPPPSWCSI